MPAVLQLTKRLKRRPRLTEVPGVALRHFAGPQDIDPWLEVRRRAFARQKAAVGNWDVADFQHEFLAKPWWTPEAMWLAEMELAGQRMIAGTITLARRGEGPQAKPVVHWLAVVPGFRRRGLGRLLVATLETAVWQSGARQIWLETHSQWTEAVALYQAMGYRPVETPVTA